MRMEKVLWNQKFLFFLVGEKGILLFANTFSLSPCFQPECKLHLNILYVNFGERN